MIFPLNGLIVHVLLKGPYINDVRREGEGEGQPISDKRKGGCVNLVLTRGGRGPKS